MKRFFLLALLMLVYFFGNCFAIELPELPTQNTIPLNVNFGPKEIATPTLTVGDNIAVALSDYLPTGTIGFTLRAASGDFIFGAPNTIATGTLATDRVGDYISEGETYPWYGYAGQAGNFPGVVISNTGTGTLVIDQAWGLPDAD